MDDHLTFQMGVLAQDERATLRYSVSTVQPVTTTMSFGSPWTVTWDGRVLNQLNKITAEMASGPDPDPDPEQHQVYLSLIVSEHARVDP